MHIQYTHIINLGLCCIMKYTDTCDGHDFLEYCNENRNTAKDTQELVGEYINVLIENDK